ncbi:ATP phosphoribosyltransferase regulatory subunit [Candidatus Methylospira mobilis]|uniref:ATP phosphoribosyltransferase regulatory subunit n=1 Tax=Candidatus Methylospira mobilis TaxID=1808979 RepID=A0A5Q0BIH4_9GAMM|nr:ATP phosphoribosyltransferase regulatory subunit [Candidatus Methylospira mobilis]QFY42912.1 ATP phosphoribosyltransferase regulatory subunit [Candidatus Methylospira mobilis]
MLSEEYWLLPEGIEEILPAEAKPLERLRRDILDLFERWGYDLVIPPFVEFMESLLTGAGHDLDLQTFKIIDQISGRLMGVRADMTPQVARIDARNSRGDTPTRFCYSGTVLHTQSDCLHGSRSPWQIGAELYGSAGCGGDAEIIRLALEMFSVAGIPKVYLDLGHVGIYRGLAKQAGLHEAQEAGLFGILQRKATPELRQFVAEQRIDSVVAAMLIALTELNGGSETIVQARKIFTAADAGVRQALDDLEATAECVRQAYPHTPIHFDLAELRGYHYQTGVVFAVFVSGYGREVARGGRYDEIGKVFGRARPATGFSADLKVMARLSERSGIAPERIYAPLAQGDTGLSAEIRQLRQQGRVVIEGLTDNACEATDLACSLRLVKATMETGWELVSVT